MWKTLSRQLPYGSCAGFTLVELMVGMVLGIFITGAVIVVFVESERSFGQDDRLHQMQESGRFTLQLLAGELIMAGFWGSADVPDEPSSPTMSSDCGASSADSWALNPEQPIQYHNGGTPVSDFYCVASAVSGTHALAIKRAGGKVVHDSDTESDDEDFIADDGEIFVRATGAGNQIVRIGTADDESGTTTVTNPPGTGERDWPYLVRIYYIGSESVSGEDNVPVLKRKVLNNSTMSMDDDPGGYLVEGIQFFAVQFGLDTDADKDGLADTYTSSPTAAQIEDVVSARVSVLARSTRPDLHYTNDKVYNVGGVTFDYSGNNADHFYRRVYSTTVQLRNQAYRRRLSS